MKESCQPARTVRNGSCLCSCRSALILYRQILDAIEKNDYDNFSQRAYVSKTKKFASLPMAFMRAMMPQRA